MNAASANKVLIMAGGTGGHVYPALTVADKLLANNVVVEWLGTRRGIENELVPKKGLPLHYVSISGLRGKNILRWLLMPWQLVRAVFQGVVLIRRIKPDVILGLGGFASGPGGLAAWLVSKPLLIHEQNAVAGTTNRWLNRLSNKSLQAFPNSLRGATTVGNPLREEILQILPPEDRKRDVNERSRLLILGGSLGALKLNQMVPEVLAAMDESKRPLVWHQTGRAHHQLTMNLYQRYKVEGRVDPYIDAMHLAYAWADLIICRAGALTVSEISATGVAAIFIPYPHAIDDHQTKNAQYLVDNDAAVVLQENDLSVERLKNLLEGKIQNREELLTLASNARAISIRDAADKVAEACMEFAHG